MAVILFGYYGYDNAGDEKLLDETVRLIKAVSLKQPFWVASGPCSIPFPSFSRWNIFLWIFYLLRSRSLIFGGGSVFQSQTSFFSLLYYLVIVRMATLLNCQVILLSHGWGPFKTKTHERFARSILSQSNVRRSWRDGLAKESFSKNDDPVFSDLTFFSKRTANVMINNRLRQCIGLSDIDPSLKSIISNLNSCFSTHLVYILNNI